MRTFRITIALLSLLLCISSWRVNAATDLSTLAWMAGNWTGVKEDVEMEELWLAPKGNSMLAVHRDVNKGRTVSFEFLRIEATQEGITYWASPKARPAVPFRMIESQDRRVVFENAEHDFPRKILYWLSDDGSLHAKIEGTLGGKPAAEEWTWRRTGIN
jgi:Domain of unknown function (DUF6265)